jgi:hypothetical protein
MRKTQPRSLVLQCNPEHTYTAQHKGYTACARESPADYVPKKRIFFILAINPSCTSPSA